MPSRRSALEHLKAVANTLLPDDQFFSPRGPRNTRRWVLEGVTLEVIKRTYSQAEPTHISYTIDLGSVLPEGDTLTVYVKAPKDDDDDNGNGIAANRATYKRCLDDLIANKASFSAERFVNA